MAFPVISLFLFSVIAITNGELITELPFSPPVNFKQYAGYYDVGNHHFLHYWFVESQGDPAKDPVLLWLTGGPGCSGFSALLTEYGPYTVQKDGLSLKLNPFSWNKVANVLTLEAPAGVGYSYSSNGQVYTDDNQTAYENFAALKGFFTEYPQFKTNDFYLTGESYGGIYIPTLAEVILKEKPRFAINLKGMAIGNGCVSESEGMDTIIQFTYNHGMINENTWKRVETECCDGKIDGCEFHTFKGFGFCPTFAQESEQNAWYSGINPYDMYSDCVNDNTERRKLQKRYAVDYFVKTGKRLPDSRAGTLCLDEYPETVYMNLPAVRKALFVPSSLPAWEDCSDEVGYNYERLYGEMQSRVQFAIESGLRVLLYNGDTDMACNFLMGQRFTSKLGYAVTSPKKAFHVNGQVGGFHTQYGKAAFATVRGAGHMVPTDKPAAALHIIDAFLKGHLP